MKKLIIHDAADEELWHGVLYYEEQTSGLGFDFLSEAEHAFDQIQDAPERWQWAKYDTQCILLRRFPYTVYYQEFPNAIWVVAIAPQKRRPFYWRSRLKDYS